MEVLVRTLSLTDENCQKPPTLAESVHYPPSQSTIDETTVDRSTVSKPDMFRSDPACRTEPHRPGVHAEPSVVEAQLLTLNDERKIAFHKHAGELWVAEFRGECVELVDAATWFRFHGWVCHTSFSLHRALQSAVPLSSEKVIAIEQLHQRRLEHTQGSEPLVQRVLARGNTRRLASIVVAKLIGLLRDRRTSAKTRSHRIA
jgi:hypothetical protein